MNETRPVEKLSTEIEDINRCALKESMRWLNLQRSQRYALIRV